MTHVTDIQTYLTDTAPAESVLACPNGDARFEPRHVRALAGRCAR
jgi:hypothetical protein